MQRLLHGRFQLGDWLVDPDVDSIERDGRVVKLEPRVMRLLVHLAERAGENVTADQLLDTVWSGVIVTPGSVYTSIAQLRRTLEDVDGATRYIVTVPRRGYRLVVPVVPVPPAVPVTPTTPVTPATPAAPVVVLAPAEPTAPALPMSDAPLVAGRRAAPLRIALAVLAVAAVAVGAALLPRALDRSGAIGGAPIVAVLPLRTIGAGVDDGLAEGLAEELSNGLAAIPGVRVVARSSSLQLRDANPAEVGRRVGATHVVLGTLQRDATRLRVTVQLADVRSGLTAWSSAFDRPASDVLAIQRDLSQAVIAAIVPRFASRADERVSGRLATDSSAFATYLEARESAARRTPESLARATALYQRAATVDPRFALAQVGLAEATMLRYYYDNLPLASAVAVAEPALARAFELDRLLPEAYAARGLLRTEQWRLLDAEADLRRAVLLNPNFVDAYVRLGTALEYQGRPREALVPLQRAAELDPLHFVLHVRRCLAQQNLGRFGEARAACDRATDLEPTLPNGWWARGLLALAEGRLDAAIDGYQRALDVAPQRIDLWLQLGWLYLDDARPAFARTAFDTAIAARPDDPGTQLEAARAALAGGDDERVRATLERVERAGRATAGDWVDGALLGFTIGDTARALRWLERARAAPDFDESRLLGLWLARWGRSPYLTLALADGARGDASAQQRRLADLQEWIDDLQEHGQAWAGLDYLAAGIAALRGDRRAAFTRLDAAARGGWQRAWWARRDPTLASVRGDPRFAAWLARIEARRDAGSATAARSR